MNALTEAGYHVATRFATVCPKAPPGAQAPVDQILGYVLWAVGILFLLGVVIGIGGLVAGRIVGMPHASKVSISGLVMVFIAAIGYFVLPSILDTMMGTGCI
ncbi:hypothetical protein [Ornithinimicrobium cavernae]|uniref:hypothetical protein n=1 Tax=Ornithinimicrobium cavernae TaxID=2666047 RepID=UPI000D699B8F|nr:hypothetical protein [Ornithinimicrobium cavernae]